MPGQIIKVRGSTLLEVLLAVTFMSVALIALAKLSTVGLARNRQAKIETAAIQAGQEIIDWLKAERLRLGYDNFSLGVMPLCGSGVKCCLINSSSNLDNGAVSPCGQAPSQWFSLAEDISNKVITVTVGVVPKGTTQTITLTGKIYKWQR